MRPHRWRRAARAALITSFGMACLGLVAAPAAARKPVLDTIAPRAIEIQAEPFDLDPADPTRRSFGKLTWLGGLVLSSPSPLFGGYSGLALDATGARFMAVSDAGLWLSGTLRYERNRVAGVGDARTGPLLAAGGRALPPERDRDAEEITPVPTRGGDRYYIAFEQNHRIAVFDAADGTLAGPRRRLRLPKDVARQKGNSGIEAMAVLARGRHKGALVAFSERRRDRAGNHVGWLIARGGAKRLTLKRLKGFDLTGMAALPDGGVLVLERRFRFDEGVKMRLRRLPAGEIRTGALMVGEVLFETDDRLRIDNMEGVAVHRAKDGTLIATLVSDDNFNRLLQRTLLMQFRLPE